MGKAVFKRGAWWIDYRANGKRYREKIGPTKSLAKIALCKRLVEIAEGRYIDKKVKEKQRIKFEDFADEYYRVHCKPNHKSNGSLSHLKLLKTYFSGKCLHEITPQMVAQFKSERLNQVKPASVNRALACLKSLFNRAIEWEKLDGRNPVKPVKLAKEDNQRLRFLEKNEIVTLVDNCNFDLKPIVTLAVCTGMRLGEILNLKWRDVDFVRNIIYLYVTKNNQPRELPMNNLVKRTLIGVRKHSESEYIFVRKDGSRILDIRKPFSYALKKSGIIDFHFHDLRHTFASQLVMGGVNLNTVRELLGHKTLQMTLRYSHLSPNYRSQAVGVLDRQMDTRWAPKELTSKDKNQDISLSNSEDTTYEISKH